jgi:adenine-specific DNA-methyltransferase
MKKNNHTLPLLSTLDKEALIKLAEEQQQQILLLEEDKRMQATFSNISETGANDAALMWRGRNRFLAEKVKPVNTKELPEKSYPVGIGGDHRIYDGDNLAVMRSLLSEFRGGPKTGFDVIYIDPPYNTGKDTFAYNDNYRFSPAEVQKLVVAQIG